MSRLSDAEIFDAVVRKGGFSAAARELGLTQSALSRRIAALEERLGVRLLARGARGVRPTDAGATFYAAARRALAELDAAEQAVAGGTRELRGTLRLHLPPAFGRHAIVPIATRFAAQHPALVLHLTLADRVASLADERGDLAVRIGAVREAGLIARRVGETRSVACAAPRYLEQRGRMSRPEDLAGVDALVLSIYAPLSTWVFGDGLARRSVRVAPRLVSNDVESLVQAARAGLGVALLPEFAVADDLRDGVLVPLLGRLRSPAAPIHALWPARRHASRAARAFLDFLIAELAAS